MEKSEVDGGLIDVLMASSNQDVIDEKHLQIVKVIYGDSGYGIVLVREMARLEADIRSYLANNEELISQIKKNFTIEVTVEVS